MADVHRPDSTRQFDLMTGRLGGPVMKWVILAFAFAAGVAAAIVSQMVTGWWLNSGRGVAFMMAMLCALSVALVWLDWIAPLALWAGMVNATIVILFWIGAGNIFPIVIVFAGGLSAIAIAPGWIFRGLADALRLRSRRRERQ
jgi:hypothetical protein